MVKISKVILQKTTIGTKPGFFAYVDKISFKTFIDAYPTENKRLAGRLASKELNRLKHHPRKLRARGWII